MNGTTNIIHKAEAEAVAEVARKGAEPRIVTVKRPDGGSADVLLTPEGFTAEGIKKYVDEYRTAPERRKGTAVLQDLESFIAHVNRFKDAGSVIFADKRVASPSLQAVLDYHHPGADGAPRFGTHRAAYAFPLADEWRAWRDNNGKWMEQEPFARFIEDRLMDVADPEDAGPTAKAFVSLLSAGFATAAKLLDLSRGLSVHVGRRVANHSNIATGEAIVTFAEEHSDAKGQPLKIPTAFLLQLPVFRSGALYQVPARLRYRIKDSTMSWAYELHGVERVFDHALTEACDLAREKTELPLFAGAPETGG